MTLITIRDGETVVIDNPFAGAPLLSTEDQIAAIEAKLARMVATAETGREWADIAKVEATELVPLLRQKAVPADPLRKTAPSFEHGTQFSRAQIEWIMDHDWFVRTKDRRVVVLDRFTYNGFNYSEHVIWGGTFEELRDWAGY